MMILVIITIILCILFLGAYLHLKQEVRSLKKQLQYTREENSSFTLFSNSSSKEINELVDEVNKMKNKIQNDKSVYLRNEKDIRDMIVNISHDIRTPLTSIQGYIEMMQSSDDPQEKSRYYQIVVQRLQDVQDLLDEFFLYTKILSISEPYALEKIEIYPLLCHEVLKYSDLLQNQNIEVCIECDDEGVIANIHEESFQRICMNLIMNALRYGQHTFKVTVKSDNIQNTLIFENGLQEETKIDVEHIFERFYQGDIARTQQGSGLGLAIVQQLIEHMNGKISAEVSNQVLRFEISLPKD